MKKITLIVAVMIAVILLNSCGNSVSRNYSGSNTYGDKKEIVLSASNNPGNVRIDEADYAEFDKFVDYNSIECPYSELFGIDEALEYKATVNFCPDNHSFDFLKGENVVDAGKLYETVQKNNEEFLADNKFFYEELSDTRQYVDLIAEIVNSFVAGIEGIDMNIISCNLGNLKILTKNTTNYGTYNYKTGIFIISPSNIEIMARNRHSDYDIQLKSLICHETLHLIQAYCCDADVEENDIFYGTSFEFDGLSINPLNYAWLYEGTAELFASEYCGIEPGTYRYMIENIETIALANILNDNIQIRQHSLSAFNKNTEKLYEVMGFSDVRKSMDFMYAVQLLRFKDEEFKAAYESKYGLLEDYEEFLKRTYNPYFVEVTSKLFYKNLAYKLVNNEIMLNDVLYLVSMYELDLMNAFPFNNKEIREKYSDTVNNYLNMRTFFFEILQKSTNVNVYEEFINYKINYEDKDIYANAALDWLSEERREYILKRNESLYNKYHKCLADVLE